MENWTVAGMALMALGVAGCGAQTASYALPPAAPAYSLPEDRAISVVSRVLDEWEIPGIRDWEVQVPSADTVLTVDVRLGDSHYGIEWVSQDDRAVHDRLPEPEPNGTLRLVSARVNANAPQAPTAQVLLLDHASYRYSTHHGASPARRGAGLDVDDVEAQLERDVRDFLEYIIGQQTPGADGALTFPKRPDSDPTSSSAFPAYRSAYVR